MELKKLKTALPMGNSYKPGFLKRGIKSKIEGFQRAKKNWVCNACLTSHELVKPDYCILCAGKDLLYFQSVSEAIRYKQLRGFLKRGVIDALDRQVTYSIDFTNPVTNKKEHICNYIADFVYRYADNGEIIVEDVKGNFKGNSGLSDVFILKRKLMEVCHNIKIVTYKLPFRN